MKADDIRNIEIERGRYNEPQDEGEVAVTQNRILREIAAQLAEANEHLAKIANPLFTVNAESPWVTLTFKGMPFVIDRNEVSGVAPVLDSGIYPPTTVSICMKGQPWSKSANGTVEEICAKLGIPLEGQ